MFGFAQRKRPTDVHRLIRRILDTSTPNFPPPSGDFRWEDRSNRTLPVLLAPLAGGEPMIEDAVTAVTKNLSSQGLALVLTQPFHADEALVGLWDAGGLEFVLSQIRQNVPLGGGFWQLGLELLRRVTLAEYPGLGRLLPLAEHLKPPPRSGVMCATLPSPARGAGDEG